jgi:hypothetical protein
MTPSRFSLTEQQQASAESLLVAMQEAAPPGAQITIASVVRAVLARGFAALASELNNAPKHWASLERDDDDGPPESSARTRRAPSRPVVVPIRGSSPVSAAPAIELASAEILTRARALIALAAEAAIVSADARAGLDARLTSGALLSTVRELVIELVMAAPIGSAVDRAGRELLREVPGNTP